MMSPTVTAHQQAAQDLAHPDYPLVSGADGQADRAEFAPLRRIRIVTPEPVCVDHRASLGEGLSLTS
jgi:hypothetical protein